MTNPQTPELIADFEGTTSEGGAMMFTAYYGEDEMPYRLHGLYSSLDGGGMFDVERWEDLPFVVNEGAFSCVRKTRPRTGEPQHRPRPGGCRTPD
jgi:hypothetical protein